MRDERIIVRGYTTFCDDIRQETNGKLILIGVYGADMLVPTFPFALPRLCLSVVFRHYLEEPKDPLTLKVFGPGLGESVLAEMQLDLAAALVGVREPDTSTLPEDADPYFGMNMQIALAPITVNEPGFFRVRAFQNDTVFKLGSLEVKPSAAPPL